MLTVISLGAGVQSTTMALMVKHGDLPPVDGAIFADTGWEPKKVYAHLDWLETVLPFPVHRVSAGDLRANAMSRSNTTGGRFSVIPWYVLHANGDEGIGRRQCTKEYKITPILRKVRELLGGKTPKSGATMLIGISMDEAIRMKPSRVQYIVNQWPLIDKRMNRRDCLKWLADRQYPTPPKSACIGCPYTPDSRWRDLRDNSPEEWRDAVEVDRAIRHLPKMRAEQYMHSQRVPLDQADLRTHDEIGQPDLFNNECEGMCGV